MEVWKTLKKEDCNTTSGNVLQDLAAFGLRTLGEEHELIKELSSSFQVTDLYHWVALTVIPYSK